MLRRLDGGLGAAKVCRGLRHPRPIVVILDLDQQLALLDALKIVHPDMAHIPFDLGAERRDVAANISIVCDCRVAKPTQPSH